ncbi:hypothetical protein FB451DRAFT_1264392 [Mycena latifolia]|nr:hypothetical protein FB451DRAFT_1264392 [Mycena latifolia]
MAVRLPLVRLVVLSTVLLFSLITLGLAGALTSALNSNFTVGFTYSSLAIATAVITMITVAPMIALEIMRPGGPTSMIIFEIVWLSILWILWLSTGAEAAEASQAYTFILGGCGTSAREFGEEFKVIDEICRETSGIEAFAFLNWIILMVYTGTLLTLSLAAASRKHTGVWQSSVAEAPFFAPASPLSVPTSTHTTGTPAGHGTAGTAATVNTGTIHV